MSVKDVDGQVMCNAMCNVSYNAMCNVLFEVVCFVMCIEREF